MSTGEAKLARLLWLSVAAAVVTIALKTGAWLVTGSVGLLSDAAESLGTSSLRSSPSRRCTGPASLPTPTTGTGTRRPSTSPPGSRAA